jgi:imidazolonepropionase-like amidohydrolase
MIECGLTPYQALQSGTGVAARLLGLPDRGSIAVGQVADMVLFDANPLDDPAALRLVAAVFQHGRRVA